MSIDVLSWIIVSLAVLLAPPLLIGCIRKTKARLQGRIGAPIFQPLLDIAKMLGKGELISTSASSLLRFAAVANAAVSIVIALGTPWIPGIPALMPVDLFLFVYLFVLLRFFTVCAALDTSSPFAGFAASREVTLAVLVEPAIMLCLAALAVAAHSASLTTIFSFAPSALSGYPGLWVMAGCGLYLSTLVEMSRMPADDPTTHLELTMVHEAMILENSGPNLAVTDYATALRLLILLGVTAQCFIHAIPWLWTASALVQTAVGAGAILVGALSIALIEGTVVKLRWTQLPDFIGYAVTFGLLSCLFVLGVVK